MLSSSFSGPPPMCTAPGLGGSSHLFLPRRHYQSFWITWYLIILFGCRCRFTSTCMWHLELGRAMGIKQVGFCNKRIFYILATMLRSSPFPHLIGFSFLSVALCIASSTLPLLSSVESFRCRVSLCLHIGHQHQEGNACISLTHQPCCLCWKLELLLLPTKRKAINPGWLPRIYHHQHLARASGMLRCFRCIFNSHVLHLYNIYRFG